MMKWTVRAFSVFLVAATVLLTGCARDLWPFGGGPELAPGFQSTGGTAPTYTELASRGTWQALDQPMALAESGMQTGEQRWDEVVYFAFDRATIGATERVKIEELASHLQANSGLNVIIEGHADERGSDEYNRNLSQRRALAVRDYLVSLGVSGNRIDTVGYGEERPVIPAAATEAEHAQNRRAEFLLVPQG